MANSSESIDIFFVLREGGTVWARKVVSAVFSKDRYQPGTELSATVLLDRPASELIQVRCFIGGKLVHEGICEYIKKEIQCGRPLLHFRSHGFSAMLAQNEPVPGMNYQVNLTRLGRINTRIPNVSYESGTTDVNYIYVKERSTIWDAVSVYAMKAYGTQPFIYDTNTVRVTKPQAAALTIPAARVVTYGELADRRRVLSRVFLADFDGTYPYVLTNTAAEGAGIVRERYYPYDTQWNEIEETGVRQKLLISNRRSEGSFVSYLGFSREDLFTPYSFTAGRQTISGEVHSLEVRAEEGRIVTTLTTFDDGIVTE